MTVTAPDLWPSTIPAEWKPKPTDELLHVPFGDESLPWKETFYISLYDHAANANVNMHMTVSANRTPNTRAAVGVTQGNHSVIQVCREDGAHSEKSIGNSMTRLEIVNLSWDSNHEVRWVGELDEVSFDLTLRGKHFAPLWDTMFEGFYARGSDDGASGQVYCHTEQVVVAEGTLTWKADGKIVPFNGFGWRDRGWGRRKTQLMWNTGWDLVSAVLPDDSVFSFIALRSHELPEPAPMPVSGWYSDATSLSPLVTGWYHKEATACPMAYHLEFDNGVVLDGSVVRPAGRVAVAMQEAEVGPEAPGVAATMQDYYAIFTDASGAEFPVFSQNGYIHKVDVFRGAQFIRPGVLPVKG
ncbi:MAG: hypothetical protein ACT4P1_17555 [Sporichthyaceae bacterium]